MQIEQQDRLEYPKIYERVDEAIARYHAGGGLNFAAQAYKLASLVRILDDEQPNSIIELGAGSSTAIFAAYAKAADRRFVSVEEDEHWAALAARASGIDRDQIVVAPREVYSPNPHYAEINYDLPATENFDLIFVDGPNNMIAGSKIKSAVNANCLRFIEAGLRPRLIVIDGRRATVEALQDRALGYSVEVSEFYTGLRPGYRYFSIARRETST